MWPPIWGFYLSEFGDTEKSKLSISNKGQEVKGLWGEPLYELLFSKDGITYMIYIPGSMETVRMTASNIETTQHFIEPIQLQGKNNANVKPFGERTTTWGKLKGE